MMIFEMTPAAIKQGIAPDYLGSLPDLFSVHDSRSAAEQVSDHPSWFPNPDMRIRTDGTLIFPGDPDLPPLFMAQIRDEIVYLYRYSWVAIVQSDGSYVVSRLA